MRIKLLFSLAIVLYSFLGTTQSIHNVQTFGTERNDYFGGFDITSQDEIICTGSTQEFHPGPHSIVLLKTDKYGSNSDYRIIDLNQNSKGRDIKQSKTDDNYFLLSTYTTIVNEIETQKTLLSKLSPSFQILESNEIENLKGKTPFQLEIADNGDFIILSNIFSRNSASITRLDSNTNLLWENEFIEEGREITLLKVRQIADNNVIVTGWNSLSGTFSTKSMVVKLDLFGNVIWKNNSELNDVLIIYDAAEDKSGNLFCTGVSFRREEESFDETSIVFQKIDSEGDVILTEEIFDGSDFSFGRRIEILNDSQILIFANSSIAINDFLFVILDHFGSEIYRSYFGGDKNDLMLEFIRTSSDEFCVGGITSSFGEGQSDIILFEFGDLDRVIDLTDFYETPKIKFSTNPMTSGSLIYFLNPFKETFITNPLGQIICKMNGYEPYEINSQLFTKGLYYVSGIDEFNSVYTMSFIIM